MQEARGEQIANGACLAVVHKDAVYGGLLHQQLPLLSLICQGYLQAAHSSAQCGRVGLICLLGLPQTVLGANAASGMSLCVLAMLESRKSTDPHGSGVTWLQCTRLVSSRPQL